MNDKIKFRKFRIFIFVSTCLLLGILFFNFFMTIRTPFSGTTYLQLPSNYYVTDKIEAQLYKIPKQKLDDKNDKQNSKIQKDAASFIPPGSFILAVNDEFIDLINYSDSVSSISEFKSDYEKWVVEKHPDSINAISKLQNLIIKSSDYVYLTVLVPNTYPIAEEKSDPEYYRYYAREYRVAKTQLLDKSVSASQAIKNVKYLAEGIFLGFLSDGGATDRAGIKSGDILLEVDGVPWKVEYNPTNNGYFLDYKSLYKLRTQPKGDPLEYKILRNNQILTKNVTLATFGIPINLLIYLFIGIIFTSVGWIYSYNHPQYTGSRLTGLWLIIMGFSFGTQMQMVPMEYKIYGLVFTLFRETLSIGVLGIIIHSFSYFPTENKEITRRKWIHILIYSVFFLLIFLIYASYFELFHFFSSTVFLYTTLGLIAFYISIRFIFKQGNDKKYRRANLIMISIFASIILFGNIGFLYNFKNPILLTVFWYFTTFLTVIVPLFYIYVAWKYRIYDISLKIRKNMQYNMLTFLWQLLMVGCGIAAIWFLANLNFSNLHLKVIGSNIELFSQSGNTVETSGLEKFIFLVLSAIIILVLFRFSFSIQKVLNRKFYRQKFDYKKSQNELIKLIQTNFTLRDLARIIVEKLSLLVHLKRVSAVFYKKTSGPAEAIYCYDSNVMNDFCYLLEAGYYDVFNQFDSLVGIERLPDNIQNNLEKNSIKYIIPIKSKGNLIATIFIGEKLSETAMTMDDFDFIHSITSHISVAIENAFLYEDLAKQERIRHELEIARNIQLASLPQSLPHISGLDVSGVSIPAHEVGGDFYDFYNGNGNDLTVVVGDVSGKGTSAALYMSKVQGILRTLNEFDLSPKDLFIRTNRLLYKNIEPNSFITAIGAHFDFANKEMHLSRAGHLPLVKYSFRTGQIEYLLTSGIGLGLANEDVFENSIEEIKYPFERGDIFLFLSDGLTDARNTKMEEFGMERLAEILIDNSENTSKYLCDAIIHEVRDYAGESGQFDDITAVVVKVTN